MTTLDRFVEIEGLLEGGLLEQNYDQLTEETGPECKDLALEYMGLADSVSHKDIIFIKQLTKVIRSILKSDPDSLDGLLERVFQFNNEGVQIIEDGLDGYTENRLLNLKAHFFADKGDVSEALYGKTQDIAWAEKWHSAYKASADMSTNIDPRHAAYAYGFAGDAAKALFDRTGDTAWAEKWYEATHLSADMTRSIDPQYSAVAFGIAGNAATAVYKVTRQRRWYNRAIMDYRSLLENYDSNPNPGIRSLAEYAESTIKFLKNRLPPLRR